MDPKLLGYLAVVVQFGSISRAAERLFMTQPTLTRALKVLEAKAGGPVLLRTRYGVKPTPLGTRLADVGERILKEADYGSDVVRQWREGFQDEVRIGAGPFVEFAVMESLVDDLLNETGCVTHFKIGSASALLPELQKGTLDFLLAPRYLEFDQAPLARETLFEDEIRIFVGVTNRFYGCKRVLELDELADEHWILSGVSAGFFEQSLADSYAKAPHMVFTGAIISVVRLLRTSNIVVQLPMRFMLHAAGIDPRAILKVQIPTIRRDIALWRDPEIEMRPDVARLYAHVKAHLLQQNQMIPDYGIRSH